MGVQERTAAFLDTHEEPRSVRLPGPAQRGPGARKGTRRTAEDHKDDLG